MNSIKMFNKDYSNELTCYPDNHFDVAICDPPYFKGPNVRGRYAQNLAKYNNYDSLKHWETPKPGYIEQLKRVSKNQIVFGINYLGENPGPGRIIWDKVNDGSSFSDAEIAYSSYHDSVRIIQYMWSGMMQGKSIYEPNIAKGNKKKNEKRIHPTQKPVNLYLMILRRYVAKRDLVLDTHMGSGSLAIACDMFGCDFIGFEIDKIMYEKAKRRYSEYKQQLKIDFYE